MAGLTALQKFDLVEELIQLCADAIRLRHPRGKALAQLRAGDIRTWPDVRISTAVEQMRTWVADHDSVTGQE